MTNIDIVRAWKDADYRASLGADELAALPPNPAGAIELVDEQLAAVCGGYWDDGGGGGGGWGGYDDKITYGSWCSYSYSSCGIWLSFGMGLLGPGC